MVRLAALTAVALLASTTVALAVDDGSVTVALTSRQADAPAAGAAVGALAASFLGAYVRARGVSLGYPVEEGLTRRTIRYGLVALGLGAKVLEPAMFALLALSLLAAAVRGEPGGEEGAGVAA